MPSNRRLRRPPGRTGSLARGSYNYRKRSLRRSRCEHGGVFFGKEKLLHEGLRKNLMHMIIRIKEVNLRKNCRLKLLRGNRPELVGNSAPHGDETERLFMTRNGNKTIFLSMQVLSNLPQSVRFFAPPPTGILVS